MNFLDYRVKICKLHVSWPRRLRTRVMFDKLYLIDGHSLIFRMYYAFLKRPMINSKGEDVSILFGFMKYVLELIESKKPTHLAICFDPPGKTFRHELYPDYKGTRSATPELVIQALEPLTKLCSSLHIPVVMIPGFEGDDVLGSIAIMGAKAGAEVYMVTPDKDFAQLVRPHLYQLKPGKAGAEDEVYDENKVCEKYGLDNTLQVIDWLTLCGDSADNVPGVNGIGEVSASKLLKKYGSVENIYAHISELSPAQQKKFREAENHISLSKTLVTIKSDIDTGLSLNDMVLATEHDASAGELFEHYEFNSLMRHLHLAAGAPLAKKTTDLPSWKNLDPEQFCTKARKNGLCSINVQASEEGVFSPISRIVLATHEGQNHYISESEPAAYASILEDASVTKCGYRLKAAINLLLNHDIRLQGKLDDLELMHYLVNPEKSHKIELLCRSYLNINMEEDTPSAANESLGLFDAVEEEKSDDASMAKEALVSLLLDPAIHKDLAGMGLTGLFYSMEEPLQKVLAKMERDGVKVDLGVLESYAGSLQQELVEIEARVRQMCGDPNINLASPKQVGVMLFESLGIDPKVKPKKDARYSYPTDEETLLNYADKFPIINEILEYRAVKKLLGTYIEPFGTWVSERDGRIHSSFNQALTATGRLSSSRPNLQNIPIRTDRGREIRKAFCAEDKDSVIVSADYSQIELRLMAHFCADENMRQAFCLGQDIHAATAAKIFNVPIDEVSPAMRRTAKTANFGIIYGISAFGLSQRLHIPRVAAKKIIEDYFAGFPSIERWIENSKAEAAEKSYVQTLFGRRRYLPDINSRNANVRALAERNAVNAPIQGTAADIIKMAMINLSRRLEQEGMRSRMVLQIHDELLFEAPKAELEKLEAIIKEEMENVVTLSVPLTVECNHGGNWLEAH